MSTKKLFGQPKSDCGRVAKGLTISLYPEHMEVLRQRERQFNISRSILLQMLLEIEQRQNLLRRELLARLTTPNPEAKAS